MKIMLVIALLCSALWAQNGPVANGIYAVEEGGSQGKGLVVRQYDGKGVVLDTAKFVPLAVVGKPQVERGAGGSWLVVQLAPAAARHLADLTRSQMNRAVAVVVGDRIVFAPKVRSVIQDGKARVTPCDGESCAALVRELSK